MTKKTGRLSKLGRFVRQQIVPAVMMFAVLWLITLGLQCTKRASIDTIAPPDQLMMTEEQARLTRQAIELVREAVVVGRLQTTELTLEALWAELPRSVRERVMKALGNPDMESMRDALDILDGNIITEGQR